MLSKIEILAKDNNIALNFVSSPGSGNTSLLKRTIKELDSEYPIAVVEGGQHTDLNAERTRKAGVEAYQINTGKACHLDAHWSCF